jgi:hypothetical protein
VSDISKKPIEAKDVREFLDWLSTMNPSTSSVDSFVDTSIIKLTSSKDKFTYQCLDKEANKEYTFVTSR